MVGGVFRSLLRSLGGEGWGGCTRVFSMRVIYQGGPKQDLDQEHSLLKVSGGWWVGVSWIIASALVLLRQELRPVLEVILGE